MNHKSIYLHYLHDALAPTIDRILSSGDTHQNKAKSVNRAISEHHDALISQLPPNICAADRQQRLIVLQYCISVASLEYRHAVWPYEYMALSRRVGELWERFCSSAWHSPSKPSLQRISPPAIDSVLDTICAVILEAARSDQKESVANILNDLRDIIGEINMVEDQVFTVDDRPHVIDFKSGFGSNEKGNMLRLRTVGKAYRLWNSDTRLLFLVRQERNNNYLEVIRREGLWEVHCGLDAYATIDQLTGSNMSAIRQEVVDFEADLSEELWKDLSSHLSDLTSYLRW